MSTVILETACGCRALRTVEDGRDWRVALHPPLSSLSDNDDLTLTIPVTARRFVPTGHHDGGVPIWRERGELAAVPPGAPESLTHGEWADAVARFRLWCRGDLPQADADFLRRHDGGTVLAHKSGALVGVFYAAPGWEHSQDAVAMFSQLRSLMEEAPDDAR